MEILEKEIIRYEKFNLPVKLYDLSMHKGVDYRGMHSHVAIEIVEVKSGVLDCYVNNNLVKVYPSQILFINRNTGHRLYSDNAEIIYIHFDMSIFEEKTDDNEFSKIYAFISHTKAKPYLLFDDNIEIIDLLHKIKTKYYQDPKESHLYLKAYLYELVAFMYSQFFITPFSVSNSQIKKIEPIVKYIGDNFKLPITLNDICSVAKYSKYTTCHIFKEVTGATIFDYVNFLRINYAVEKLKQKDNSVLDIATESGFSSATYFNRVFKGVIGCSPSVYRKFL